MMIDYSVFIINIYIEKTVLLKYLKIARYKSKNNFVGLSK